VGFFDVGQGDSALVQVGDKNILIDGGPDNVVLKRLGENLSFFNKKIDLVILSHYHDDHVSGLIEVIKRYQVNKVIYLDDSPSSLIFEEFLETINEQGIDYVALSGTMNIQLESDCIMQLISPAILAVPANNNNSIIAKLDCRHKKFLSSGRRN